MERQSKDSEVRKKNPLFKNSSDDSFEKEQILGTARREKKFHSMTPFKPWRRRENPPKLWILSDNINKSILLRRIFFTIPGLPFHYLSSYRNYLIYFNLVTSNPWNMKDSQFFVNNEFELECRNLIEKSFIFFKLKCSKSKNSFFLEIQSFWHQNEHSTTFFRIHSPRVVSNKLTEFSSAFRNFSSLNHQPNCIIFLIAHPMISISALINSPLHLLKLPLPFQISLSMYIYICR